MSILDSRVIKKAQKLLKKYGNEHSIRTLDAIQLAACLNEKASNTRFVCADTHLLEICQQEGLHTINPETEGVAG